MPNVKKQRREEDVKRELTALLREVKDPRVSEAMLTIVFTEFAQDLSFGKVYISSLYGLERATEAVKVLKNVEGHFRKELAARLHMRKAPELKFIADDRVEQNMKLFSTLAELRKDFSEDED